MRYDGYRIFPFEIRDKKTAEFGFLGSGLCFLVLSRIPAWDRLGAFRVLEQIGPKMFWMFVVLCVVFVLFDRLKGGNIKNKRPSFEESQASFFEWSQRNWLAFFVLAPLILLIDPIKNIPVGRPLANPFFGFIVGPAIAAQIMQRGWFAFAAVLQLAFIGWIGRYPSPAISFETGLLILGVAQLIAGAFCLWRRETG